jgi:cell division protein FtsB
VYVCAMQTYGYPQFKDPPKWLRFVKHKKLTILLAGVFVAVVLVTFSNKGLLRRFLLESEVVEKTESIQNLKKDIQLLKKRQASLETDLYEIEKVAREEHGMIKPGEVVYLVKTPGKDKN